MGLLDRIRRHAAVATGNFGAIFKDTADLPPLPAAAAQLASELNAPDPDMARLDTIISSSPELAVKVIRTVNSSLYSLRSPVESVRHALSMLGIAKIRELVLAYAVMDALPAPRAARFDHEAFWVDSLIRALFAKAFARRTHPGQEDMAFTIALLADLALPILLSQWEEYYAPILDEWQEGEATLSSLEREHFGWDHGQAAAWIVKSWDLSEEMVCYVGAHNLDRAEIDACELGDTIAAPIAVAARVGSVLRPETGAGARVAADAASEMGFQGENLGEIVAEVRAGFAEVKDLFGLSGRELESVLQEIAAAAEEGEA